MKLKILILLLLSTTLLYAQQINLKGTILDAQSNLPVAATTISIANKNIFFPADEEGKFSITNKGLANADTVSFSCIGYQTKKMLVGDVLVTNIIKLLPMINSLREVRIGSKPPKLIKVGSKRKIYVAGGASYFPGAEQAMFMMGSANVKGIVKTVGFYLLNGNFMGGSSRGDAKAPFRIRLYNVNSDGTPGLEITKDIIVISAKKSYAWFDVDISSYQIENPEKGFYVAFCLLEKEFYHVKYLLGSSAYMPTPRLGFTQHEFKEELSYRSYGMHSMEGLKWRKDSFKTNYMIRATIGDD